MLNGKVYQKLAAIQTALKAPKSQFNKFGGYKYRKAEDILEAVKPLLKEHGCALTCSDDLQQIGDRYYIKATAMLICAEDGSYQSCEAYAREEEEKKGMDGSQVTGASSSYARKYALNGLLCIDDTADSDTTNVGSAEVAETPAEKPRGARTRKTTTKDEKAPVAPVSAPAKTVVTDENIKQIVDWVCKVPAGEERDKRQKRAEEGYEWPGNLIDAFRTMVDFTE
jgi:hypothetical protein